VRVSSKTGFLVTIFMLVLTAASQAQQFYATNEAAGQLEIVDLQKQTITVLYTAAGRADSILVNAQKQLIYDLSPQGILALYDPATNTNTVLLSNLDSPRDLLFDVPTACNPNANANTMLVSEYSSGQIIRYNFTTGTFTKLGAQLGSKATGWSVDGLAYDAQGELFAIANHSNVVQLDPCTGAVLKTLVLEPHYKIDGGDGMVYDPYTGQLWISHDGSDNANGLIEVPTDLSSFSLFQSGNIPVPDGIVSDGKGNLYIGAGLQRLVAYNIPTDTLAHPMSESFLVPGLDSLELIPGTPTSTGLLVSPNPAVAGQTVTLTATITPTPTGALLGTVSFYNGATLLNTATVSASGISTFTTSSLPAGADSIKATYSGNIDFAASASSLAVETITGTSLTSTSTVVTASPNPVALGQSVTLAATLAPPPTGTPLGTVNFYNSSTLLNTANVNSSGAATFATSTLPAGSNSITAAYSGNPEFAESTSSPLTLTITAASTFTISTPQTPVTVAAGGSANFNLTVTPAGGAFNGLISFAATGQPTGSTVTFNPSAVAPGNSATPIAMTIQLAAQSGALPSNHKSDFPFSSMFLAAGLCVIGSKYRRVAKSLQMSLLTATLAGATLTLSSCGGGAATTTPPPASQSKTYVITVTASSPSSPDAATTVKLIVQ
jgi:hypothetical protein